MRHIVVGAGTAGTLGCGPMPGGPGLVTCEIDDARRTITLTDVTWTG